MASRRLHVVLTVCWLLSTFSIPVPAQSSNGEQSGSQSTTTAAAVLEYRSVFEHYYGYDEIQGGSWREANDTVGLAGGGHIPAENMAPSND